MIPVDSIEQTGFNPEAIVNGEHTPRLQIDYGDGYKFAATGENAVKVWDFLNRSNSHSEPSSKATELSDITESMRSNYWTI